MRTAQVENIESCVCRVQMMVARMVGNSTSRIDSLRVKRFVAKLPRNYRDALVLYSVTGMAAEKVRSNQSKVEEAARKSRDMELMRINRERYEKEEAERKVRKEMEKKEQEARRRRAEEFRMVEKVSKFERLSVVWGPAKDHPEMAYTGLNADHRRKTGEWISFPKNGQERAEFRKWMQAAGHDLEKWVEAAKDAVKKQGKKKYDLDVDDQIEYIEAEWYEGGVMRYWGMKRLEWLNKAAARLVEDTEKRVRLEVTEELLNSEFALGDGTVVSWGEATVKEHEVRISVLQSNIVGNAKSAALHLAAVKLIKKHKVTCLRETVGEVE